VITRLGSLLLLVYALGFVLFAFTLGKPARADAAATDAAVVLTGGAGRLEHAIDVLKDHKAGRLLVAGADAFDTNAGAKRVPNPSAALCRKNRRRSIGVTCLPIRVLPREVQPLYSACEEAVNPIPTNTQAFSLII